MLHQIPVLVIGGRAGYCLLGWYKYYRNITNNEIEALRLTLLGIDDVNKIRRAVSSRGISASRSEVALVKRYIFNSPGIMFTPENYNAWKALPSDKATIDDVRFFVHELAEVRELQKIQRTKGFNFLGNTSNTPQLPPTWRGDFDTYYIQAHSEALRWEYMYLRDEISALVRRKIAFVVIAAIDPTRAEGRLYMQEDNIYLLNHPNFQAWANQATQIVPLNARVKKILGVQGDLPKEEVISRIKRVRLIKLP